jgi:hypothetical protein
LLVYRAAPIVGGVSEFQTPIDIANRALQHCGATPLDPVLGFTENSRNAGVVAPVYGKLREAELQSRVWSFATKRVILRAIDANTMLLAPSLWSSTVTYFAGSVVADASNNLWRSRVPNNLNNDPQNSLTWEPYSGPMTAALYDASGTTAYSAGEVVYTAAGNGTYKVYLSLQNGNADVPGTATVYDQTVTYFKNQVVTFSAIAYMSLIDLNLNNTPSSTPLFNIATTYATGNQVGGSDGVIYSSVGSGNLGHDPTTDGGVHWTNTGVLNPWTTVFVGGIGSDKWLEIGGSDFPFGVGLTTLNIVYPIGAGPSTQTSTANVYRLPAGYLRMASQNPKPGMAPLGGPSGVTYNDWLLESGYLITSDIGPIRLRFVANLTDVRKMHAMFCESLAARIGIAICPTVTQSSAQLATIASEYKKFVSDAMTQDAIEDDYDDPPDDDYISVRY